MTKKGLRTEENAEKNGDRRRIDHGKSDRAFRRSASFIYELRAPFCARQRVRSQPALHCGTEVRRAGVLRQRDGFRGAGTCRTRKAFLRAGSAGGVYRHPQVLSRRGRGGGAGRRGREDHLYHGRHRTAHERFLRGRHGRLYRPDGHPAQPHRGRDGQALPAGGKGVSHRFPLRRVCQIGHSAAFKPGRQKGGHLRQHFPGGGRSDGLRPGAGQAHQGQSALFGRASVLYQGAAQGFLRHPSSGRRARDFPRKRALLHVHRRCIRRTWSRSLWKRSFPAFLP